MSASSKYNLQLAVLTACASLLGCSGNTVEIFEVQGGPFDGGPAVPLEGGRACEVPEECGPGRICHPDGLCHPSPTACGPASCQSDEPGECLCSWTCNDASEYQAHCVEGSTGLLSHCTCSVDGEQFGWTCVLEVPTPDVCGIGPACCSFPR